VVAAAECGEAADEPLCLDFDATLMAASSGRVTRQMPSFSGSCGLRHPPSPWPEGIVRCECKGEFGVEDRIRWSGAVSEMEVCWSSGVALQGEASNHRKLRRSRAGVVSVAEKACRVARQV
jgi:hypothetical protein